MADNNYQCSTLYVKHLQIKLRQREGFKPKALQKKKKKKKLVVPDFGTLGATPLADNTVRSSPFNLREREVE